MACSQFQVGDLVWAKVRGYPHWPAKVVPPPPHDTQPSASKPHFVFFYGTHEISWMAGKDLLPYEEHKEEYRKSAQRPGLNEAIWEIEEDPSLERSEGGTLLRQLEGGVGGRGRGGRKRVCNPLTTIAGGGKKAKVTPDTHQERDLGPAHPGPVLGRKKAARTNPSTASSSKTQRNSGQKLKSSMPGPNGRSTMEEEVSVTTHPARADPSPTPVKQHHYHTRKKSSCSTVQTLTDSYCSRRMLLGSVKVLSDKSIGETAPSGNNQEEVKEEMKVEMEEEEKGEVKEVVTEEEQNEVLTGSPSPPVGVESRGVEGVCVREGQHCDVELSVSDHSPQHGAESAGHSAHFRGSRQSSCEEEGRDSQYGIHKMELGEENNGVVKDEEGRQSSTSSSSSSSSSSSFSSSSSSSSSSSTSFSIDQPVLQSTTSTDDADGQQCAAVKLEEKEKLVNAAGPAGEHHTVSEDLKGGKSSPADSNRGTDSNVPADSSGGASVPADSSGEASVPADSSGEASVPADSSGGGSVPTNSSGEASVPADSSGGDSVPTDSNGGCSVPADSNGGGNAGRRSVMVTGGRGKGKGKAPPQLPRPKLVPAEQIKSRRELKKERRSIPPPLTVLPTMSMVQALQVYDFNIKVSLVINHIDCKKAMKQLKDLLLLNFSTSDVESVPELVGTLRKLRRFTGGDRVRKKAEEVYAKIKLLYATGPKAASLRRKAMRRSAPSRGKTSRSQPLSVVEQLNQNAASEIAAAAAAEQPSSNVVQHQEKENNNKEDITLDPEHGDCKPEKEAEATTGVRRSQRSRNKVDYSKLYEDSDDMEQVVP